MARTTCSDDIAYLDFIARTACLGFAVVLDLAAFVDSEALVGVDTLSGLHVLVCLESGYETGFTAST
ncbi:hypothetical protein AB4249_16720 [Vibrio sp. 10N.261.55.F4]|uniref:hypothetical protein n=1 Tax=Vibrio sp. 10N.261.55.F4 TaxID=3229692 RepID=UPI00354F3A30